MVKVKVVNPQREAMEQLGERIAEQAAHLDAAMHRLLADIREYDAGHGWHHAGALSCAHWLSWRIGWTLATGREHVRVARRLGELPRIDEALRTGELSYSKVRAITRVATAATEETLLADAQLTTASQLETLCRKFRMVQRLEGAPATAEEQRRVTRRELDDGMVRIEAVLRPDEAAIVMAAIEGMAKRLGAEAPSAGVASAETPVVAHASAETPVVAHASAETPVVAHVSAETPATGHASAETRRAPRVRFDRADALVAMAQSVLRGDAPDRSPVEVVVTVPRGVLQGESTDLVGAFGDGSCVSAETSRRLTCDAGVVELVEDEQGRPLSVGRRTRTLPVSIKRALLFRDRTCRFPGCTNRLFLEGHHIEHWISGGETSLENLCALCSHHHAFVHEHGYRIEMQNGEPVFFDDRGRRVADAPARVIDARGAWTSIRQDNASLGITATTGLTRWDGRPIDYSLVVGSLGLLERRSPGAARS